MSNPPLTRVAEIRLARGMINAEAARAADMNPRHYQRFDTGERPVTSSAAPKLAQAFGVPVHELYRPTGTAIPEPDRPVPTGATSLEARWFKAARWAYYGRAMDLALSELKLKADELEKIEAGETKASPETLMILHTVSGIPMWWFRQGKIDGVPPNLAYRIGIFDGTLLEDY